MFSFELLAGDGLGKDMTQLKNTKYMLIDTVSEKMNHTQAIRRWL